MASIISLFVVVSLSILITRIATLALTHTGLSRESARFQARSAFTGVGFTTAEAENVVNHPLRRKILMHLMLLGNVGIVTAVSSLILGFVNPEEKTSAVIRLLFLFSGIAVLWYVGVSSWIDRHLCRIIDSALNKYTDIDTRDYASLLGLTGEYQVNELNVKSGDWMADSTLKALRLRDEGVIVLGIRRKNNRYVGAPNGDTKICEGDTLIIYGRKSSVKMLDRRKKGMQGDEEHSIAKEEQKQVVEKEKVEEEAS